MLVDNCAMQLIRDPSQFDVIATENLFGDILSDEAAMLTGCIGMLPCASVGAGGVSLYEPIHGSAPDIAGKGSPIRAPPSCAAMMLDLSFDQRDAARAERGPSRRPSRRRAHRRHRRARREDPEHRPR